MSLIVNPNGKRIANPSDDWPNWKQEWFRDNQFSYTMFLANQHNTEINLTRQTHKGVLDCQFEAAEELEGTDVSIRPVLYDKLDDAEYPSVLNFQPAESLREITQQPAPLLSEINVAFPLQHAWQDLETTVRRNEAKLFLANPPVTSVKRDDLTPIQKFAYDCMVDNKQQIV